MAQHASTPSEPADSGSTDTETATDTATDTGEATETPTLNEASTTLLTDGQEFLLSLVQPWRFYQIGVLVALFVVAHILARYLIDPKIDKWLRGLKNMRPSQLRFLLLIARRSRIIVFALLAWATVLIMREVTWPSRSYLIALVATLASAWAFVAIATRLIRNPLLQAVVRYGAWIFATITILNIEESVYNLLDAASIDFGSLHISLLTILKAALALGVMFTVAAWVNRFSQNRLKSIKDLSPSMRVLAEKMVTIILFGIAFILALKTIGFDLSSLALLSGAIGVGLGFGLQKIVSNFVSGFILLLDKSIKPGDVISLGDTFGWIQNLSARYVSVLTRDGREYLIPNEDLITGQVVNWSHSNTLVRLDIHFGVDYASDPHLVRKIAREAAAGVDRVQETPAPVCHITDFGDSSIDFILRFWIDDPSGGLTNIRGNVFLALWDTLKEHDINIPFPRRDVQILNETEFAAPTAQDT